MKIIWIIIQVKYKYFFFISLQCHSKMVWIKVMGSLIHCELHFSLITDKWQSNLYKTSTSCMVSNKVCCQCWNIVMLIQCNWNFFDLINEILIWSLKKCFLFLFYSILDLIFFFMNVKWKIDLNYYMFVSIFTLNWHTISTVDVSEKERMLNLFVLFLLV